MSFEVVGGDFGKGGGHFGFRNITLPTGQWGKKQEVPTSLLRSVEIVSQETIQKNPNRFAWGIGGAAVMGPLGLLTGLLPRGTTQTKVAFIAELTDGRSFLATTDHKTFLKIKAASVGSNNHNASGPGLMPIKAVSHPQGLSYRDYLADAPANGGTGLNQFGKDIAENLIALLRENGWQAQQQPKRPGQRYHVILAQQGIFAVAIACTTDTLSDYLFDNMVDALDAYPNLQKLVLGNSIPTSLSKRASSIGVTAGELHQAMQLIPA